MAILHLLRSSPFASSQIDNMIATLAHDDCIALVDDGCYLLHHEKLSTCTAHINKPIVVIKEHAKARQIKSKEDITLISYGELVTLFAHADSSITW